jgi:hypothetical protein
MHTLSSAARAVGTAKSTIYRLSAHRLKSGTYAIYPGELRRAFPSIKAQDEGREGFGFPVWDVS